MNHLQYQKSPYLQQHATNPVDWYPWGEERPDLDDHYMAVCQLLTGSGGWPFTIVMTPEGKPFFAATYIPRENAYGLLGMLELLPKLRKLWMTRRSDVLASADAITRELGKTERQGGGQGKLGDAALRDSAAALANLYDAKNGGFGSSPKFPMPGLFSLLLRAWKKDGDPKALQMTEGTLTAMRNGGIFDQLGGGFHRYSTDAAWLVPHFEKMLYKELLVVSFDPVLAATLRLPAERLRAVLLVLLAVTVVVSLQSVGIGLVSAMLVTPGATAYLLTRRLPRMMALAALFGALASVIGLYASYYLDVVSGAAIVLTATAFFLLAFLFAPRRGLVWRLGRGDGRKVRGASAGGTAA